MCSELGTQCPPHPPSPLRAVPHLPSSFLSLAPVTLSWNSRMSELEIEAQRRKDFPKVTQQVQERTRVRALSIHLELRMFCGWGEPCSLIHLTGQSCLPAAHRGLTSEVFSSPPGFIPSRPACLLAAGMSGAGSAEIQAGEVLSGLVWPAGQKGHFSPG